MSRMRSTLAVLAVSLGFPMIAGAADPSTAGACREDAEKLCADAEGGALALIGCLREHRAELSPACADALKAGKRKKRTSKKIRSLRESCGEDAGRFCENAQRPMQLARCLRQHADELEPTCRDALPKRRAKRKRPVAQPAPEAASTGDDGPPAPDVAGGPDATSEPDAPTPAGEDD